MYKYSYNIDEETDLMASFTPPEKKEIIATYHEKAQEYNGSIFYINMLDGGRLYKYDTSTGNDVRVTSLPVADFLVHDAVLYYSTVRLLVNYDLYRLDLVAGEPERISTEKCKNFLIYGGNLYYNSFSGDNTLNCMNLETLEIEVLFDDESVNDNDLTVYEGELYFVADDMLYRYSFSTKTAAVVNKELKPLEYLIYDGKILMMNTNGAFNSITVYDIATDKVNKIGNLGLSGISDDLRGMFVYNREMYFYRNVAADTKDKGLYKIEEKNGEYSAVLVNKYDGYYLCESIVVGEKLYFIDVWQMNTWHCLSLSALNFLITISYIITKSGVNQGDL